MCDPRLIHSIWSVAVVDEVPVSLSPLVEDGDAPGYASASNLVPALVRGLRLMQAFSTARPKLPMSELVAFVDAPRSTVARLVRSLVALGFLVEDGAGRFSPGLAVLGLGASYLAGASAVRLVGAILDELADRTLAAAQLLAVDGMEVVVAAQAMPVPTWGACAATRVGARFGMAEVRLSGGSSGVLADGGTLGARQADRDDDGWTVEELAARGGRSAGIATVPLMAVPILRHGRVVYALSVAVQEGVDAVSMVERASLALRHAAQRFVRALHDGATAKAGGEGI